jgi:hypothetical protein
MVQDRRRRPRVEVPLSCPVPECRSARAVVAIQSASIVTFRCSACGFMWSAEIDRLPDSLRQLLQLGLLTANPS